MATDSSSLTAESVRAEMRRVLTSEEREIYRGLTRHAMTGTKYDKLYDISTAEELIKAEWYGKRCRPKDEPDSIYLLSSGHGIAAKQNPAYTAQFEDDWVHPETLQELHEIHRAKKRPDTVEAKADFEEELSSIAQSYVDWVKQNPLLITHRPGCQCKKE